MSFDLSMDSFEENFETGSGRVELTVGTQAAVSVSLCCNTLLQLSSMRSPTTLGLEVAVVTTSRCVGQIVMDL